LVGDLEIADEAAGHTLDEAKVFAKTRLAAHVEALKGRDTPRVARVFEWETHQVLAQFRMTAEGPFERVKK
jgi:hypothetical protein